MSYSDAEIKLGLLENGLDFIVNSLSSILVVKNDTEFKYSVLHIADGTELIIKEILKNVHWSLLFDNVDKANRDCLDNGDFSSVKFDSSIERLKNICDVSLDTKEINILKEIRKRRNRIQHFEFKENKESIQSLVAQVLLIILRLINENINIEESSFEAKLLFKKLSEKSVEFDSFTKLVLAKHKKQLDEDRKNGRSILNCPKCFQQTLIIGGSDPECLFCGYADESEKVAHQYVENILGISEYSEIKDGGNFPVEECPNCKADALVLNALYTCFNCGEKWKTDEMDSCIECNQLYPKSYLKLDMCNDCYDYKFERFGES